MGLSTSVVLATSAAACTTKSATPQQASRNSFLCTRAQFTRRAQNAGRLRSLSSLCLAFARAHVCFASGLCQHERTGLALHPKHDCELRIDRGRRSRRGEPFGLGSKRSCLGVGLDPSGVKVTTSSFSSILSTTELMKQMNLTEDWTRLIRRRCVDATRRSRSRGCPEAQAPLEAAAGRLLVKQAFLCALCGKRLQQHGTQGASLDRIFSSVRKSPQRDGESCKYLHNMRWVCWSCNHKTRHCHMKNAEFRDSECK